MNVEIKRFSDSDEDFAKTTECRKKAVWSKSYVTIPLLFFTKEQLAEDTGISADPYAIGCQFKDSFGNVSGTCSKKWDVGV